MADIQHGIRTTESLTGSRPITTIATSVIGIVATANDADAEYYPLNTAVLETNIYAAIGNAGVTGTLKNSLEAIAAQCQPTLVIVRVEEAEVDGEIDEATTFANVIGSVSENGKAGGLKALVSAQSTVGVVPRIIVAPGLDADQSVANALVSSAQQLNGYTYCRAGGNTMSEAIAYREAFAQREIMLLWPDPMALDTDTAVLVAQYVAAYAAGQRSKTDSEKGWHWSMSNLPLNGVAGLSHDVSWALTNNNHDAAILNAADITTITSNDGYRFWGNRGCSSDPLFAFECVTRSAQVIKETIAEGLAFANDRPMSVQLVKDVIATINAKFREMTALGQITGGEAWFNEEANVAEAMKGGKLYIDYQWGPMYPTEHIGLTQIITDQYLSEYSLIIQNG